MTFCLGCARVIIHRTCASKKERTRCGRPILLRGLLIHSRVIWFRVPRVGHGGGSRRLFTTKNDRVDTSVVRSFVRSFVARTGDILSVVVVAVVVVANLLWHSLHRTLLHSIALYCTVVGSNLSFSFFFCSKKIQSSVLFSS